MILINKDNSKQNLVLTLAELTTIANPVYLLVLKSDFNGNSYRFILQNNLSSSTIRYDYFQLDTSLFTNLDTGIYSYKVYQSGSIAYDETTLGNSIESGKAEVFASGTTQQAIIYTAPKADSVTYKG